MSEAVLAPVFCFGGGVVMVVALSLTMTTRGVIDRVFARLFSHSGEHLQERPATDLGQVRRWG